ncbi:aspartate--tRNA ligase [Candidatus Woesearchaeota archaeon CG11_big_fil_rev_8_21_14_0_20_43_8]|nr:MAG: aspartate--tRNA ligase [Candidatus Woesearchaeota archaeon CG11_big_fil_rev_8_21_14_0_20_43_8]PIO04609.1 MAG: aspartate--tRNA ligase [Candidatus Woesearchaeota archaeon CG08_land_8_20_14_0_20_43_7]
MKTRMRTHTCGNLRLQNDKEKVSVCGWVQSRRDHGGIIFIDLRDRHGLTQVVFDPSNNDQAHKEAEHIGREWVLKVDGTVRPRGEGLVNPRLPTGEVEVVVDKLEVLNKSDTPPMEIDDNKVANEDFRLKYRYLDLRRPIMQKHLETRHKVAQAARSFFNEQGFLEIETPLLIRSTPEGARDYMVPSRVNPGQMYSLPQSPQLYKQILMVSGCDRYYQIARCLRDEDLRTDRQPEFTQIDVEMSFVEEEDIYEILDGMVVNVFKEAIGVNITIPIPRMTFHESMERYGCDKPDLRFGLELVDVSEIVKKGDFGVFKTVIENGGIVKCINPNKNFSRKELDEYIVLATKSGAKGMAWMKVADGKLESNIAKFFKEDLQKEIIKKTGAKDDTILFFVADRPKVCNNVLARLRNKLGEDLKLYDPSEFRFVWIVDFPLFEYDDDIEAWMPAHHMFTMPKKECLKFLDKEPGKVVAHCYDLVLNGVELGSGSIRVHRKDIQEKVMKSMGITEAEALQKFGFLLEAFRYGAPPHGGFAFGVDRLVALMCGFNDIREVMAFPKNKNAQCPMDGCPSQIDDKALKDVHLKWDIVKPEKKGNLDNRME